MEQNDRFHYLSFLDSEKGQLMKLEWSVPAILPLLNELLCFLSVAILLCVFILLYKA